jgi:hypothetical protein
MGYSDSPSKSETWKPLNTYPFDIQGNIPVDGSAISSADPINGVDQNKLAVGVLVPH